MSYIWVWDKIKLKRSKSMKYRFRIQSPTVYRDFGGICCSFNGFQVLDLSYIIEQWEGLEANSPLTLALEVLSTDMRQLRYTSLLQFFVFWFFFFNLQQKKMLESPASCSSKKSLYDSATEKARMRMAVTMEAWRILAMAGRAYLWVHARALL